ncbi:hypothetical protein [Streptomyces sp. NPDC051776]|uniref:hypothetical protein n=1 Tax=Streptomyces sp. NPDC051776 TaxID=3155414 RepID=UPI003431E8FB
MSRLPRRSVPVTVLAGVIAPMALVSVLIVTVPWTDAAFLGATVAHSVRLVVLAYWSCRAALRCAGPRIETGQVRAASAAPSRFARWRGVPVWSDARRRNGLVVDLLGRSGNAADGRARAVSGANLGGTALACDP